MHLHELDKKSSACKRNENPVSRLLFDLFDIMIDLT